MCCFSRPVKHVSKTSIFARDAGGGRQTLVYSMKLETDEDLAMVLPLPVVPGSGDDAVEFISLQGYPDFFKDLASGFPMLTAQPKSRGLAQSAYSAGTLEVHKVGDFEASYVPTIADFSRLDERFRLPDGVWDGLPGYADYGFAVFKLRMPEPSGGLLSYFRAPASNERTIHPMAFTFPSRLSDELFFPTVHIHDGSLPAQAKFDHTLYCQTAPDTAPAQFSNSSPLRWNRSEMSVNQFVDIDRSCGLVDGADVGFRTLLFGMSPNADTLVPKRIRRSRAVLERAVAVVGGAEHAAKHLALLDAMEFPGWLVHGETEMMLAFVRLWQQGDRDLADWLAEPEREWNILRSQALRPRALDTDYNKIGPAERVAIDRQDAAEVEQWLSTFQA